MKIILLSLLVALSSCQATVIEERPSPFLPNATLHKMILDPNRVELAKGLIDQIFSDGNLECQEKINFINCYMAKFRALIFSVNRSKKNVKGEGKKRDDNAEQMLERLEEVKAEIIESGEKVGELNRIL